MEINLRIFICCFALICNLFEQTFLVCAQSDDVGGELNYPCKTVRDCRSFGYVCRENSCQCGKWYIPDIEKKKCIGGVDQKCLYDEHCINGAYCMNQSICKCKQSSSQPLDHGLVCAGVTNLKPHWSIELTFVGIGFIINMFGRITT